MIKNTELFNFNGLFRFNKPKAQAKAQIGIETKSEDTKENVLNEYKEKKEISYQALGTCRNLLTKAKDRQYKDFYDDKTNTDVKITYDSFYNYPSSIKQIDKNGNEIRIFKINPKYQGGGILIQDKDKEGKWFVSAFVNYKLVEMYSEATLETMDSARKKFIGLNNDEYSYIGGAPRCIVGKTVYSLDTNSLL